MVYITYIYIEKYFILLYFRQCVYFSFFLVKQNNSCLSHTLVSISKQTQNNIYLFYLFLFWHFKFYLFRTKSEKSLIIKAHDLTKKKKKKPTRIESIFWKMVFAIYMHAFAKRHRLIEDDDNHEEEDVASTTINRISAIEKPLDGEKKRTSQPTKTISLRSLASNNTFVIYRTWI